MKKNTRGFSIIIALWIVLIITLIAFYILEYIIPFSRNVKGIENATKSYYLALSWQENALFFIRENGIWVWDTKVFSWTSSSAYNIISTGTTLPLEWFWTSDFDKDWSKISPSQSVQVFLPTGINWANVNIYFRVPYFSDNLEMSSTWDIVNWQILGKTDVLNADDGQRFSSWDICNSSLTWAWICPWTVLNSLKTWFLLDNTSSDIPNFYNNNCNSNNYDCILKLSIISDLIAERWIEEGKKIPYLEYRIDFDDQAIPTNIIQIEIWGLSYGFRKDFTLYYPLDSLIDAYDFTVFQ